MQLAESDQKADLFKLSPEEILLKWFNFHLKNAGASEITNLGRDLADSVALTYLLNQLDQEKCSLDALNKRNDLERANAMINNSKALGVADVVGPADIIRGNVKVNLVFISEIFNTKYVN